MTYQLFIDDERFPADHEKENFLIVRSSAEAKELMDTKGCPSFISFDHDLGGQDDAMEIVHWMITRDLDARCYGLIFIPEDFAFYVHSQNVVGAKNIKELLNSYLMFRKTENGNLCL